MAKKEGVPNLGGDPENVFKEIWNRKAEKWQDKIKEANFPEELESTLLFLIDKEFLEQYVNAPVRDRKMLEIFVTSFYSTIQESGEDQGKSKFDIFNMMKKDIEELYDTNKKISEN